MFDKMALAVFGAYYKAKAKLVSLSKEEDGMETIETVILIAIAVIIAGVLLNFLTGEDGKGGIISQIFKKITDAVTKMFSSHGMS